MNLPAAFQLLRAHQWVKNIFVAAPFFFSPEKLTTQNGLLVLAGVASFSAVASAIYIFNDYCDRKTDRMHPEKRHRPLAAETVSPTAGLFLMGCCLVGGLVASYVISVTFFGVVAAYAGLNILYSVRLKYISIIDIAVIAIGFILRVLAGAVLIDVQLSVWIIICTGLLALFIATAKRRDDLVQLLDENHRASLRGYNKRFLDACSNISLGALIVSYSIYTANEDIIERLGTDKLYFTIPFVILAAFRYLQITIVEQRSGSPSRIIIEDLFMILVALSWMLTTGILLHL